jgi:hypothetical protein
MTFESKVEIPMQRIEQFLQQFDSGLNWRDGLRQWFNTDPPTGLHADNERTARQVLGESILHLLMPTVIFGAHSLPERTVSDDAEKLEEETVRLELLHAGIQGNLLADALDRIRNQYGVPEQRELEIFIIDEHRCDARLARSLATGLRLFWGHEYDASAHLVVPKIEAAARALLLELDEPLYRVRLGQGGHGQFPGLGVLLDPLVMAGLDPEWERFLGTFLLSRGQNYRNLLAHGFLHEVRRVDAALALRACAVLVLISPSEASSRDADTAKAFLAKPLQRGARSWFRRFIDALLAGSRELRR